MDQSYVFSPAERRAETVDEFLAACADEPRIAAAHLQQGYFEPWLRDRGWADLADLAAAARRDSNPDDASAALSQFLSAAQPGKAAARRKSPARATPTPKKTTPEAPAE